jgi:hypothetical protein
MKSFFIILIVSLSFQASYASEGWSISTIDTSGDEVGRWVSLAIDDNGDYHIAYTKRNTDTWYGELRYAYYDGYEWDLTTVDDSANVGRLPSIDINPTNGRPSIAYWDNTNWALKYATWSGSQWSIETIDSDSEFYQDLAFNSTGVPNVVYYVGSPDYDPNYAYFSGGSWQFETIEPSYIKGEYCSIAIGNEDDIWVSYFDYD